MDISMPYNGTLTAEQFLFYEMRIVAKQYLEDKSIEDWKERKILAIEDIKKSNKRVKLIVCADKLSNLKSIYYDVLKDGEQMFCKFNAGNRENVAWYYKSMIDACSEISSY